MSVSGAQVTVVGGGGMNAGGVGGNSGQQSVIQGSAAVFN